VETGANLYIGLVHYPVYDKRREIVATAVTNFDLHDMARCARTYGLGGFFVITPLESQVKLVERIVHHWVEGGGFSYNPTRGEPLSLIRVSRTIEEAEEEICRGWNEKVVKVATGASPSPKSIGYAALGRLIEEERRPFFLLFGTGWGLTQAVKESADHILAPIEGKGYNHLSVRSAVAIILDRLLGNRMS